MKTMMNKFISKAGKFLAVATLLCTTFFPVKVPAAYAAEPAAAPAQSRLKIGDSHGGGKVAYIFKQGEHGYVAGQSHGLIAANADLEADHWEDAVKACNEYLGGGFSDWRMPSKDELSKLYSHRQSIGGFKEHLYYWSSTESDKNDAWDQSFRTGTHNLGYKLDANYSRLVRTF